MLRDQVREQLHSKSDRNGRHYKQEIVSLMFSTILICSSYDDHVRSVVYMSECISCISYEALVFACLCFSGWLCVWVRSLASDAQCCKVMRLEITSDEALIIHSYNYVRSDAQLSYL